jgi:hypothetical protein
MIIEAVLRASKNTAPEVSLGLFVLITDTSLYYFMLKHTNKNKANPT